MTPPQKKREKKDTIKRLNLTEQKWTQVWQYLCRHCVNCFFYLCWFFLCSDIRSIRMRSESEWVSEQQSCSDISTLTCVCECMREVVAFQPAVLWSLSVFRGQSSQRFRLLLQTFTGGADDSVSFRGKQQEASQRPLPFSSNRSNWQLYPVLVDSSKDGVRGCGVEFSPTLR